MKFAFTMLLFVSFTAFGQVTEREASQMLEQMVKDNIISQEEANKTKVRMIAMSSQNWDQTQAQGIIARHPASTGNQLGDLDQAQLDAIQSRCDEKSFARNSALLRHRFQAMFF